MVRYLFYTIGDLTYQSPLVVWATKPVRRNTTPHCVFSMRLRGKELGRLASNAIAITSCHETGPPVSYAHWDGLSCVYVVACMLQCQQCVRMHRPAVRMTVTLQQDKGRAVGQVPHKLCCIAPYYTASYLSTCVYFVRMVSTSNYQFSRMPHSTKFHKGQQRSNKSVPYCNLHVQIAG